MISASAHSPNLLHFLTTKADDKVVDRIIECVLDAVDYALNRSQPRRESFRHTRFTAFVKNVIKRTKAAMAVLLVTLVYVERAKPHLEISDEEWASERIFLGALIVASKYVNDYSFRNTHWGISTGIFGKRDVERIEREFLAVLDWELRFDETDVLIQYYPLAPNQVSPSSLLCIEPPKTAPVLSTQAFIAEPYYQTFPSDISR
ncbi:hypothetical protein V5O48_003779 [Marasmius crinis-equi]|uniref:Cyclin N-terminal domain-containing protein n=1 Tax=Marasmius crinis-equi TaxID=585013 RepID=A0ABR3FRW9_9AGAR